MDGQANGARGNGARLTRNRRPYDRGVRLAHDVIRDAAFRDLAEETRRDVHRRLAEWLEEVAGDDVRWLREALGHRHAARLPSLDLAGRLARAPRRTLLGEEGLALLARIADEADPGDRLALAANEDVAALATELANHRIALEHWSRAAERATDPLRRASALLAASRSAFAFDDAETARAYLDRSRAVGAQDEVLVLEQAAHEAVMGLWSGDDRAPGQAWAQEVARRAHRMVNDARGVEALDPRARRAYLEALRVEYEAAYQEDDVERLLRTSEESAAAARGFDDETYLQATIANGRALRKAVRLGESDSVSDMRGQRRTGRCCLNSRSTLLTGSACPRARGPHRRGRRRRDGGDRARVPRRRRSAWAASDLAAWPEDRVPPRGVAASDCRASRGGT